MTNLEKLRRQKKATQDEVAIVAGVTQQAVSRWECEKAFPRKEHLDKLCKFFDCKIDDLI